LLLPLNEDAQPRAGSDCRYAPAAQPRRWGAKGEILKRVFLGYIFSLFFLASHASLCQVSSDSIIIPVLPPPCLLFVEEKIAPELNKRSTLKAATFTKTGFRTVELFHAQYIVATQISNHVFQFRLSFASGDTAVVWSDWSSLLNS